MHREPHGRPALTTPPSAERPVRPGTTRARAWLALVASAVVGAAACTSGDTGDGAAMVCRRPADAEALAARPSPFDSVMTTVGTTDLKLCYSRPAVRGRLVFGALVPYDTLWRTGANEPTTLHVSGAATIAGLPVEEGDYSIYTRPALDGWTVVVNASTSQDGLTMDFRASDSTLFPNGYTDEVRAQEVGRAPIETMPHEFTEQLTASFGSPSDGTVELYFDWADRRIVVPIEVGGGAP